MAGSPRQLYGGMRSPLYQKHQPPLYSQTAVSPSTGSVPTLPRSGLHRRRPDGSPAISVRRVSINRMPSAFLMARRGYLRRRRLDGKTHQQGVGCMAAQGASKSPSRASRLYLCQQEPAVWPLASPSVWPNLPAIRTSRMAVPLLIKPQEPFCRLTPSLRYARSPLYLHQSAYQKIRVPRLIRKSV